MSSLPESNNIAEGSSQMSSREDFQRPRRTSRRDDGDDRGEDVRRPAPRQDDDDTRSGSRAPVILSLLVGIAIGVVIGMGGTLLFQGLKSASKDKDYAAHVVGKWQLIEIGGKPVDPPEYFEFTAGGKVIYTSKKIPHFECTYRWESGTNDKMIIQVTDKEIQNLKAEDHGDFFTLTDMDTQEVSKFTRMK
jgi:hypothetical protein